VVKRILQRLSSGICGHRDEVLALQLTLSPKLSVYAGRIIKRPTTHTQRERERETDRQTLRAVRCMSPNVDSDRLLIYGRQSNTSHRRPPFNNTDRRRSSI